MKFTYNKAAYAKINLFLRCCGKYDNGYHRLFMLMQQISLGDDIYIELDDSRDFYAEGKIVETVVTTKVSRSMPARTSTTIKKSMSAKTADASDTVYWGGTLLGAIAALFVWMRFEQKRK